MTLATTVFAVAILVCLVSHRASELGCCRQCPWWNKSDSYTQVSYVDMIGMAWCPGLKTTCCHGGQRIDNLDKGDDAYQSSRLGKRYIYILLLISSDYLPYNKVGSQPYY